MNGNTSADEQGKIYRIITTSIAAGSSAGPFVAGVLFEKAGYRIAWSCAVLASFIGIVLQALMIRPESHNETKNQDIETLPGREEPHNEETPLLFPGKTSVQSWRRRLGLLNRIGVEIYLLLLTNSRFLGGVASGFCYSIVSASFGTTLPLHVQHVFNWGSLPTGILFAAMQGPNMVLCVPVHWLKSRIGPRYLTVISFIALAPLLWLTGVPGDKRFPWANETTRGPFIYAATITGIGCLSPFLNGVGMVEATRMQIVRPLI